MKKYIFGIVLLALLIGGCDGGAAGRLLISAVPKIVDFVGQWVSPKVEDELGLDIKDLSETEALVKITSDLYNFKDVAHATLDSTGILNMVFTSVDNGEKITGKMKKLASNDALLYITDTDSTVNEIRLRREDK